MRDKHNADNPYETLGKELRRLRAKSNESVIEVSGAVEIDIEQLSNFENGLDRPSREILSLLMSHFRVNDDDYSKILRLAGYNSNPNDDTFNSYQEEPITQSSQVFVMPIDARIVYTDLVNIAINNHGVIVNFMQSSGINNQPLAVSRVGMSKEHAKSLLEVLKTTLEQSEQPKEIKQLPTSVTKTKKREKKGKKE